MTGRQVYATAVILAVSAMIVVSMIANAAYTRHVQEQSDLRWCRTLALETEPNPPPTTPRGRERLAALRQLREDFGCGGR